MLGIRQHVTEIKVGSGRDMSGGMSMGQWGFKNSNMTRGTITKRVSNEWLPNLPLAGLMSSGVILYTLKIGDSNHPRTGFLPFLTNQEFSME